MPDNDRTDVWEGVEIVESEEQVGAAASRAEAGVVGGTHQPPSAGNRSRAESGQPRRQRRITQAEHAAYVMKKGKHIKALLWVDPKGQKVLAHMVEGEDARRPVAVPRGSPQQWLDAGWRIASWFANPKTGNMQITLIRAI